eukprot:sb/3465872/
MFIKTLFQLSLSCTSHFKAGRPSIVNSYHQKGGMKTLIVVAVLVAVAVAAKKKTTTSSGGSFCTDTYVYGTNGGASGSEQTTSGSDWQKRYYKYPLLGHCRARHLGNWKPTYKVKAGQNNKCPAGAKLWAKKGICYWESRGGKNFRDAEQEIIVLWCHPADFPANHALQSDPDLGTPSGERLLSTKSGCPLNRGQIRCNSMNGHLFVPNDWEEMLWVTQHVYSRGDWHYLGFFCSTGNSHEVRDLRTVTREDTRTIHKNLNARSHQPIHHHNQACAMNQGYNRDTEYFQGAGSSDSITKIVTRDASSPVKSLWTPSKHIKHKTRTCCTEINRLCINKQTTVQYNRSTPTKHDKSGKKVLRTSFRLIP